MSSLPPIESGASRVQDLLDSLAERTVIDGSFHTVSLIGQTADSKGDSMLFAKISVDQSDIVEYPTAEQTERLAFKITLSNCPATKITFPFQHGPRLHGKVIFDIEEECFARIIDTLKELLPSDAVLFRQLVGYGADPIYKSLGFTVKPHVFAPGQSRPRCNVTNVTLALADWRSSPKVGDKRTPEEGVDRLPSAVKKAKPDSA